MLFVVVLIIRDACKEGVVYLEFFCRYERISFHFCITYLISVIDQIFKGEKEQQRENNPDKSAQLLESSMEFIWPALSIPVHCPNAKIMTQITESSKRHFFFLLCRSLHIHSVLNPLQWNQVWVFLLMKIKEPYNSYLLLWLKQMLFFVASLQRVHSPISISLLHFILSNWSFHSS